MKIHCFQRYHKGEDVATANTMLLLSDEEWEFYDNTISARIEEAGKRIGGKLYYYDVVVRSQRLCKLYLLDAPKIILDNEKRSLAEAMVLNTYA